MRPPTTRRQNRTTTNVTPSRSSSSSTHSPDVPPPLEDPTSFPAAVWDLAGGDVGKGRLKHYAQLLVAEGELRGLIGPRELPRLWSRHIVNSLVAAPLFANAQSIADIGSGAGFPGIVLAIARPGADVTLVETMERRAQWLTEVVSALDLSNVRVMCARAEDLVGEMTFDVVTARAVARLSKLLFWTAPLVRSGGHVLALKGAKAAEEIEDARPRFRKFRIDSAELIELESPLDGEITRVVKLQKA